LSYGIVVVVERNVSNGGVTLDLVGFLWKAMYGGTDGYMMECRRHLPNDEVVQNEDWEVESSGN
jgi:hypothetical protein